MRNLLHILTAFLLFSIFMSCQQAPSHVIPQGEMEEILIDIHLAEAILQDNTTNFNRSTDREALYESVFRKHNITRHQFDTSLYWYGMNSEQYVKIYDRLIKRLDEQKKDVEKHIAIADRTITHSGDTVNIWRQDEWQMFYPMLPYPNPYTFEIKTDTGFHAFDTYQFKMIVKGLDRQDSFAMKSQVDIIFRYSKDSLNVSMKKIADDGAFFFEIKSDSLVPERIYGNLYMNLKRAKQPVFIDNLQLIRIHKPSATEAEKQDSIQ